MRAYELMADVSSNNGPINVANYSRAGHVALAVKATQGTGYTNPYHEPQCNAAHDFGLTVVHYHFCEPGNSIEQEIRHFRQVYNRCYRNGDYLCFDIELDGLRTPYADSIMGMFHSQTTHEPVLYSDRDFLETALKGVKVPGGRLWVADYSPNPIKVPKGYTLWARQYTNGIDGPEPHFYTGIGSCDGSVITAGVARALWLRKLKTRRQK